MGHLPRLREQNAENCSSNAGISKLVSIWVHSSLLKILLTHQKETFLRSQREFEAGQLCLY